MSTAILFSWWEIGCGASKCSSQSENENIHCGFDLFTYLFNISSPWSRILGEFLNIFKTKEIKNVNLTCQGAFGGSVFTVFSAWQCSSARFNRNWWLLGSCHLWKTNTLIFPPNQSTTPGKLLFSRCTHTLIWTKRPKRRVYASLWELLKGCWVFYAHWEMDRGHQTHFTRAATNPPVSKNLQSSTAGFELATAVSLQHSAPPPPFLWSAGVCGGEAVLSHLICCCWFMA